MPVENLIFRSRPNERNECDQWTIVKDADDGQDYMVQERIKFDALRSGSPYLRLIKRMTVGEFLCTDQPPAVKIKLQSILEARNVTQRACRGGVKILGSFV
jgi:hypothetical protein